MSYIVYIVECADKTYYTGSTNNLEKRLKEHNNSKSGAHYTKIRRPVVLRYKEEFETILETPILLVIKTEGLEIIVHVYGELLFKRCEDTDLMRKIAEKIYAVGLTD